MLRKDDREQSKHIMSKNSTVIRYYKSREEGGLKVVS